MSMGQMRLPTFGMIQKHLGESYRVHKIEEVGWWFGGLSAKKSFNTNPSGSVLEISDELSKLWFFRCG